MIRISSISAQLEALIGDDPDENGADTALIVCDRSADLYGYATKISKEQEPRPRAGLMAPETKTPPSSEEQARTLVAIAISSWREKGMKKVRRNMSATSRPSNPRRRESRAARSGDHSSPDPTSKRYASIRQSALDGTWVSSDTEDKSGSAMDGESEHDTSAPLLVECEHGRLLIARIYVPAISEQYERHREQRMLQVPTSHIGSRRHSYANSTRSASGGGEVSKTAQNAVTNLRSQFTLEDAMDPGFSTEDETDLDSMWSDAIRHDINMNMKMNELLLVLHAPSSGEHAVTWPTLLQQAIAFADMNPHPTSKHKSSQTSSSSTLSANAAIDTDSSISPATTPAAAKSSPTNLVLT